MEITDFEINIPQTKCEHCDCLLNSENTCNRCEMEAYFTARDLEEQQEILELL